LCVSEGLAQSRCLAVRRPGVEPATWTCIVLKDLRHILYCLLGLVTVAFMIYLFTLYVALVFVFNCNSRVTNFSMMMMMLIFLAYVVTYLRFIAVLAVVVFSCRPQLWTANYVATTDCGDVHASVTLSLTPTFPHLSASAASHSGWYAVPSTSYTTLRSFVLFLCPRP